MRTLRAASLRHLLRHPGQLALAVAGLALGVGTIVAVDIATASAARAFSLSMDAVNGAATHQILGGPQGLDERVYVALRTNAWPREAGERPALAPVVEGYVSVRGRALQLLGVDPFAEGAFRGARSGGQGDPERLRRWLLEPGAVTMSAAAAAQLGLEVDDRFEIEVSGRTAPATLIAVIEGEQSSLDDLLLTDIAQAQEWLGAIGRLSRIDVRIAGGETHALRHLRALLPPGAEMRDTERRSARSLDMTAAFTTNLEAMSLLALLVGVFLIYGAVSFAVVQRRRTFAILRALGTTRGTLIGMVLTEAAVLGLVSAAAGAAIGAFLGRELVALVSRTINDLYFVVTVNETVLPASTLAKAGLSGLGTALLAAALPAAEAAIVAPSFGLRRSSLEARAAGVARVLAAAGVGFALAAGLLVLLSGRSLFAGFVALFLLLVGIAAVTPACLRLCARGASRAAARWSLTARLACAEVAASLSRTGVAVAALAMAIAAMIGVAVMVESFRESLREWLASTLQADVYVSAPGPGFGRPERRIDPEAVSALLRVPQVAAHSASRRVMVESGDAGPVPLDAWEPTPAARAGVRLSAGDPTRAWDAFFRGALIVSEPLAWRLELEPGDALELATPQGPRRFEVAAIAREYGNDRGTAWLHRDIYRRHWQDDAITSLGLYLAPGASAADALPRLRAAAGDRQALLMRSNAELRALSMRIFERTFIITRVLYWLAAGVAALGLLSALLAWQLERGRELALLRTLGLTPRGTVAMIELQTGGMGLAAVLAAIPAGLLTAVVLIEVINRRAFGWQIDFHFSAAQIGEALALALAAALAAGLYPAWRASRAPLAGEMREE